jgi:hypothetical protein
MIKQNNIPPVEARAGTAFLRDVLRAVAEWSRPAGHPAQSIYCKPTLPQLSTGIFGSNTPVPRLRLGGFTLKIARLTTGSKIAICKK